MKSKVIIVLCALLVVILCQTGEDVGGNLGLRDGRTNDEQIPNARFIGRYNEFMNGIGSRLPSLQTPIQLSQNPNQLSPNQNQLSPNLNHFNPKPNQLSSNPYQHSPNPNLYLPPPIPRTNCGDLQCPQTWFVCQTDVCQYPIEFDDLMLRCRSSLQNGEDLFQSIADLLLTVSGRMVREGAVMKILNAKSLLEPARATLAEVVDNVVSLEQFLTYDVIGQVAEDILVDMESLQTTLRILVEALVEVVQGGEVKIPPPVYDRTFRPNDWTPHCSGRWPCMRIFIYPTRFAYAKQRPECDCQRAAYQYGARMPQELMYQQPTSVFRQVMPTQQVVQPQPVIAQPLQVNAQPHYQTVAYQTTQPAPEQTSPRSNSVFSSSLTKKMLGKNEQRVVTQPQPQQFSAQSNAQPIYVHPPYQLLKHYQTMYPEETRFENIFATPIIRNPPNPNTQQSFIYAQPQYQEVNPMMIDDGPIYDAQPYMQFPQNPEFVQGTQQPTYAPQPYTNVNQYPATGQPLQLSNEILGSQHQQSFVQTQQQQPQYPAVIQYKPAHYTAGPRTVPTSAVFNASLVKITDNSTYSQQPFVDPQQLSFAQTQQHQFSPPPQYPKLQIQYQPAKYFSGSRSLLDDEPQYNTVRQIVPPEPDLSMVNSTESTSQKVV